MISDIGILVDMSRPWDDCRFFIVSNCRRPDICAFRHREEVKKATVCEKWINGNCQLMECDQMHFAFKKKSEMVCHYESQPTGCTNLECGFKHLHPRPALGDVELKDKVAKYLAELNPEKAKKERQLTQESPPGVHSASETTASSDEDIMAMRARLVQAQAKAKSNGIQKVVTTSASDHVLSVKAKPFEIGIKRRIISSKKSFSDDEQSDISLDELTDEEQEDLRTQLNKSKLPVTIQRVNDQFTQHRSEPEKPKPNIKRGGRIISIRTNENDAGSRPSSSEWIERTITVKKPKIVPLKEAAKNPLVTRVVKNTKSSRVATDSCDSDTLSDSSSSRSRRKPNLSWVQEQDKSVRSRLGSKDEPDLSKQILKARLNRFGGEVTKSVHRSVKSSPSKGGIKSRLGLSSGRESSSSQSKSTIKKRFEPRESSTSKPQPDLQKESKKKILPFRRKRPLSDDGEPAAREKSISPRSEKKSKNETKYESKPKEKEIPPIPAKTAEKLEKTSEKPDKPQLNHQNSDTKTPPSDKPAVRRQSSSGKKSRRNSSSRADMDELDRLLLEEGDPDNLDLGGDIDDTDLFDDL